MSIKLICTDCNGVLNNVDGDYSKSGWWTTVGCELYDKIFKLLFKNNETDGKRYLMSSWMSGEISYKDMNRFVSSVFGIDENYLNDKLVESAKNLVLNWDLIKIFEKQRKNGLKVMITTDNMDIFSEYTVPANELNKYFDNIFNSADLGYLKTDDEFKLYKKIAQDNNLKLSEVLVVDDGKKLIKKAEEIGFSVYLYNQETYMDFESTLDEMLR